MNHIQVKIYTTSQGTEFLSPVLLNRGITGYVVEDAQDFAEFLEKKNQYSWDYVDESVMALNDVETSLSFYVEDTEEGRMVLASVQSEMKKLESDVKAGLYGDCDLGRMAVETEPIREDDWRDKWKEFFKPTAITDRIVVKPTWETYEKKPEELVIEIDPGMAFGTGAHPTTALCIRLLEKYQDPGEDTVLDIGCGSGILSIASALLGAKEVIGVEIDPDAVRVAQENVELNGLADSVKVMEGDLTKGLAVKGDLLAANLMADLVKLLTPDAAKHLKGKSVYISSGILVEKQREVAEVIEANGFEIMEILEEEGWCAIAARLAR